MLSILLATQNTSLSEVQRIPSILSCHKTHNVLFHIFIHTVIHDSHPAHCIVLLSITFIIFGEFQQLRSICFILPLLLQEPGSTRLQLLTKPSSVSKRQHTGFLRNLLLFRKDNTLAQEVRPQSRYLVHEGCWYSLVSIVTGPRAT